MSIVQGIDVSRYQPGTDWAKVAAAGISFVFIKATEGIGIINPDFETDWQGTKDAGLIRGAYHFFHPSADPILQAQFFLKTVGPLSLFDLPLVLDWETHNETIVEEIRRALLFLQYVHQATGKTPIIYSSPSYMDELGNPPLAQYPLWLANYTWKPNIPPPWKEFAFWQYSEAGTVNGVQGKVDMSVGFGDIEWLKEFASKIS